MKTLRLLCFLSFIPLFNSCYEDRKTDYEIHGIDVSHYQNTIDWDVVLNQNIHFAFVKASEGVSMKDQRFESNWEALKENTIVSGAYHFFIPSLDANQQAENFMGNVILNDGDLPPVLDLEVSNGLSSSQIVSAAKVWLELVEKKYGVKPIIYTNYNYYKEHLSGNLDQYPLWIARYNYGGTLNTSPNWSFWQYSDHGGVEGVEGYVDLNVFNGNLEAFNALRISTTTP